jgi:hypothetical protein
VIAGSELSVADNTVAEVNLRLTWYRFMLNVILRTRKISVYFSPSSLDLTLCLCTWKLQIPTCVFSMHRTYPNKAYIKSFNIIQDDMEFWE